MNRWWDDADAARDVLGRVDGSDVVQGVGTAALGLHALSRAAVAPLAEDTLVDAARLHDALLQVDHTPVAEAIARATEPIMGEASEAYGVLLAAELASQGAAGAQAMVSQLTAAGVPMPLALERVSHVVGVPAGYAGRFTEAMKADQVAEIVAADAADRALMTYASAQGHLEAGATKEVSKASQSQFEEAEHPRDQEGKFAQKPDERLNRLARLQRLGRMQRMAATSKPLEIPKEASLADLGRLTAPKRATVQRASAERGSAQRASAQRGSAVRGTAQQPVARTPAKRTAKAPEPARAAAISPEAADLGVPWDRPESIGVHTVRAGDDIQGQPAQFVRVSEAEKDTILEALSAGLSINARALANLLGADRLTTHSTNNLSEIKGGDRMKPDSWVIRFQGTIPIYTPLEDKNGWTGLEVANSAEFRLAPGQHHIGSSRAHIFDAAAMPDIHSNLMDPNALKDWGIEHEHNALVLDLVLDNDKRYDAPVGKAAEMWEDHQRHEVTRDDQGQFAQTGGKLTPRQARLRRLQRLQRIAAHTPPPKAMEIPKEATLAQLGALHRQTVPRASAQRAGAQRASAQRGSAVRATAQASEGTVVQRVPRKTAAKAPEKKAEFDGTKELANEAAWPMSRTQVDALLASGARDDVDYNVLDEMKANPDELFELTPDRGWMAAKRPGMRVPDAFEALGRQGGVDVAIGEPEEENLTRDEAGLIVQSRNLDRKEGDPRWQVAPNLGAEDPKRAFQVIPVWTEKNPIQEQFLVMGPGLDALDKGQKVLGEVIAHDSAELAELFHADPGVLGDANTEVTVIWVTAQGS